MAKAPEIIREPSIRPQVLGLNLGAVDRLRSNRIIPRVKAVVRRTN